jgi:hypothetical protein
MTDHNKRIRKDEILGALPPDWPQSLRQAIKEQVKASQTKVVVLDDDPTGTQTVHGVSVLTEWSVENLGSALQDDAPTFYILTNSRSFPLSAARSMTVEIAQNLQEAAARNGSRYVVVSRSDSTLRGHFPGELEALAEGLSRRSPGGLSCRFSWKGAVTRSMMFTMWMNKGGLSPPHKRISPGTRSSGTLPPPQAVGRGKDPRTGLCERGSFHLH